MTYGYDNGSGGAAGKKKLAAIGISSLILVAVVVALAFRVNSVCNKADSSVKSNSGDQISTSSKSIQAICQPTDYRQTCETSLTQAAGNISDPQKLVQLGFQVAIDSLHEAISNSTTLQEVAKDPMAKQALHNCEELMNDAIDDLKKSFKQVGEFELSKLNDYVANLRIWLSATITYQKTCLDGFENTAGPAGQKMREILTLSSQLTSNGLAMVTSLSYILTDLNIAGLTGRRLLNDNSIPSWLTPGKKRILAETTATIKPDITVAQDGSVINGSRKI